MTGKTIEYAASFAEGQHSRGQQLAQEHAQHIVQKLKDENPKRQSSALPALLAQPAPRAQQPAEADFDVDEMILRCRAARAMVGGMAEDASVVIYHDTIERKRYGGEELQSLREMDRKREQLRAEEKRQAEAREKENANWKHPWFHKTPLTDAEQYTPSDYSTLTPRFDLDF